MQLKFSLTNEEKMNKFYIVVRVAYFVVSLLRKHFPGIQKVLFASVLNIRSLAKVNVMPVPAAVLSQTNSSPQ